MAVFYEQSEFDIRVEWGIDGIMALSPTSDVVIIVDVLSFTTCVSIAVAKGIEVFPYQWKDQSANDFAKEKGAVLAGPREKSTISLSPASLASVENCKRIVLPSPNGSTLSLSTGKTNTFAGCLRNAESVAVAARRLGKTISVIACGEQWEERDTLRPAFEDQLGVGAIVSYLHGKKSPEAHSAEAVFISCKSDLEAKLKNCSSGKQLIERGFSTDVELASMLNSDKVAPLLKNGIYCA